MVSKKAGGFLGLAGVFVAVAVVVLFSTAAAVAQTLPLDTLRSRHIDLRFGMYIHFNMNTFYPGWGENRTTPTTFAPTHVDCGQWARAAKSAGMKYAILTCKHHDGFCLWPSKQTPPNGLAPYTVMQSGYPHDIVKMYVDSMRAYGIIPCIYFSIWDQASGVPGPFTAADTVVSYWKKDSAFVLGQIRELLGGTYGDIAMFVNDGYSWNMGHWAIPYQKIRELVKHLQPNCLLWDHTGGVPWENDLIQFEEPLGVWCPAGNTYASCQEQTILSDASWFWDASAADTNKLLSVNSIVNTHLKFLEPLYCNLVLNCPPNRTGQLDSSMVTRLGQIGKVWAPNIARAPLPVQVPMVEHPINPDTVITSNGSNAVAAIDNMNDWSGGHAQTLWTSGTLPQSITLDLGAVYSPIDMLQYQPRRFGNTTGNITGYQIWVSANGTAFTQITTGTSISGLTTGTWGTWKSDSTIKIAMFAAQTARYVRLTATAANAGTSAVVNSIDVGSHNNATPPTGVMEHVVVKPGHLSSGMSIMTVIGRVMLDDGLGNNPDVTVYDLSGKVLGTKAISGKSIDLHKDIGVSEGVYIVKINHAR